MTPAQMRARTKCYALDIMRLVSTLPRSYTADVIGKQLVRCATSVGANYRAACRARSTADFIAKLKIVEEEADESLYWMELLRDAGFFAAEQLQPLLCEGHEIVAIVVASIQTKRAQI